MIKFTKHAITRQLMPIYLFIVIWLFGLLLVMIVVDYILVENTPEIIQFKEFVGQPAPKEDSPKREFARQVAKKMKDQYKDLLFLSMDTEIVEIPAYKKATIQSTMRPLSYDTSISFDGQLVWHLILQNGESQEHRLPFLKLPEKRMDYKVQRATGPGNIELSNESLYRMGCMIGCFLETWVGSETDKINLFHDRIYDGWYVGDETIDGFLCNVFFYRFPKRHIAETYCIDAKTFLVRKRNVFKWNEAGIWLQTQTHHNIVIK